MQRTARAIFAAMQQCETIQPSTDTYSTLIASYCRERTPDEARPRTASTHPQRRCARRCSRTKPGGGSQSDVCDSGYMGRPWRTF